MNFIENMKEKLSINDKHTTIDINLNITLKQKKIRRRLYTTKGFSINANIASVTKSVKTSSDKKNCDDKGISNTNEKFRTETSDVSMVEIQKNDDVSDPWKGQECATVDYDDEKNDNNDAFNNECINRWSSKKNDSTNIPPINRWSSATEQPTQRVEFISFNDFSKKLDNVADEIIAVNPGPFSTRTKSEFNDFSSQLTDRRKNYLPITNPFSTDNSGNQNLGTTSKPTVPTTRSFVKKDSHEKFFKSTINQDSTFNNETIAESRKPTSIDPFSASRNNRNTLPDSTSQEVIDTITTNFCGPRKKRFVRPAPVLPVDVLNDVITSNKPCEVQDKIMKKYERPEETTISDSKKLSYADVFEEDFSGKSINNDEINDKDEILNIEDKDEKEDIENKSLEFKSDDDDITEDDAENSGSKSLDKTNECSNKSDGANVEEENSKLKNILTKIALEESLSENEFDFLNNLREQSNSSTA